ncbi:hypothetical protein ACLFLC_18215 [Providencia rettgeri]
MNAPSSKLKPKLPNRLVLSTAMCSIAIVPVAPSYAQIPHLDDLPTLGSHAIQFEESQPEDTTERFLAEYANAANFAATEKNSKNLAEMAQRL